VRYRPGRFLNALRAAADEVNECNLLWIEPAAPLPGPVRVRQIAGVLARRIVCAVGAGEPVAAGQRLGMIKLGSRTEVCLPESPQWEICIRVGQHVRAGETVLARLRGRA
jgi:phosphatidylserine decarboxylase